MLVKEQWVHLKRACPLQAASVQQGAAQCFAALVSAEAEGAGVLSPKYSWQLCNRQWLQPCTKKYAVLKGQASQMHSALPKDRWVTHVPWQC